MVELLFLRFEIGASPRLENLGNLSIIVSAMRDAHETANNDLS